MKKLIKNLINNKKITLFFVFALIASGVLAFIGMPKQESPDFSIPYAMITTVFPGASQNDVDSYVTVPIEEALKTIDGYESTFSYSSNNLSLVILELKFSTDKEESFRQLDKAISSVQKDLPESCGQIDVNTNITDTAGVLLSLSSDELTNRQVVEEAKHVRDILSEIDGFTRFEIIGGLDNVISVKIDKEKMQAAGLSLIEVVSLIEAGSLDLPMGDITEGGEKVTVDYTGGYESVDNISEIEIGYSAELRKILRLKDIAGITYEAADRNTYYSHNGSQAVILAGYFEEDINTLPLKDEIQDELDEMEGDLPESLEVSLIISQPEEINGSLINFSKNLLIAVGLVILVVLFGMGLRNAVVASVSLPLSILLSFSAMYLLGIKIHQISIAALILSLGMLVDNSIVVSDSIQNFLDEGVKRKKACIMGVKSVALPILTSTLTTIAAFAPFIFLNSLAGDHIKALPKIVCIALAASYLSAVFAIPVLGYIFFKPRQDTARKKRLTLFRKMLKGGLKNKAVVIIIVILLAAGSAYLAMNLDRIFFPASDKNIIYIDVRSNTSNDVAVTSDIVDQITEMIEGEDSVLEYTASVGGGLPRFNQIMYIYTKTPDIGQIMMRVDLDKTDHSTNDEYKTELQQKINGLGLDAKIIVKQLMYAFPMDEDLKIRIVGDDLAKLKEYEEEVFALLNDKDGLINQSKGNTDYISEYNMEIMSSSALLKGVVPAQAQNEISIAMLGREASYVMDGEYKNPIIVSYGYNTKSEIKSIPLKSSNGGYVQASDILSLSETQTLSTIPRFEGSYAMALTADYDLDYNKNDVLKEIKEEIDNLGMDNVKIIYEGEDELIRENFGQVGELGLVALAIVFIILMIQFKSFLMPLIIFITIPLSAIGSATGLYLTGQPVSFTALLGIVSLLGIVVNNAIILIDYIKKESSAGLPIKKACINASTRRLRPILLSTITTVIGLIPLAISNSDLFKPMAIALMSGLLVSTLLTLIVLPVFVSFTARKAK